MMTWWEFRCWCVRSVAWVLGCQTVFPVIPSEVWVVYEKVRPFVIQSQTEGRVRGWNGDSKRRIATERVVQKYPELSKRDVVLALELVVRTLG